MRTPKGGSSHCTFFRDGDKSITIPRQKPIKTVYVKLVRDVVETEEEKRK